MEIQLVYAVLAFTVAYIINSESCEVEVKLPSEEYTYVPINSHSRIKCTANSIDQMPTWSIRPPGFIFSIEFSLGLNNDLLNDRGFYDVTAPDVELGRNKTIELLINNTEENNRTKIFCIDALRSTMILSQTTLIIYEPSSVIVNTTDAGLQTVNVSWTPVRQSTYTITIVNNANPDHPQTLQLDKPYYLFTASEGAPPCEVYNFSVSATYVGATYTGDGCSAPSPVISRMLPSLPNVSDLNFSLEKNTSGITLTTLLEKVTYCEMYPVTNYSLEVKELSPGSDVKSFESLTNLIITTDLVEDAIYMLKITVWNSVGSVSSDNKLVYTTDVQRVTVTILEKEVTVECEFLSGSDAQGCRVILVREDQNYTVILNKTNGDFVKDTLELGPGTLPCFSSVVAFDVESDGSYGSLPVLGSCTTITEAYTTVDGSEVSDSISGSKQANPRDLLTEGILVIGLYITSCLLNKR